MLSDEFSIETVPRAEKVHIFIHGTGKTKDGESGDGKNLQQMFYADYPNTSSRAARMTDVAGSIPVQ